MKHTHRQLGIRTAAVALACLAGASGLPSVFADPTLNTVSTAEVKGPHIRLGDIVCDRSSLPAGWSERIVFASPAPGKTETIPITSIAYALQQYPDMTGVILRGTPNTAVRRTVMTLDPKDVVRAVESYVLTHDPWKGTSVQVDVGTIGRMTDLPPGKLELVVAGYREDRGTARDYSFDVDVLVDGAVSRSLQIPAKVLPMQEVWVAARSMERGHALVEGDLEPRMTPWQGGDASMIAAREDLLSQELARDVKIGQPLCRQFLSQPVCARTGDLISVTAASSGLSVTLQARALAGGRRGDQVQCVNESSKRRLLVRLTDIKSAVLDLPSSTRKE